MVGLRFGTHARARSILGSGRQECGSPGIHRVVATFGGRIASYLRDAAARRSLRHAAVAACVADVGCSAAGRAVPARFALVAAVVVGRVGFARDSGVIATSVAHVVAAAAFGATVAVAGHAVLAVAFGVIAAVAVERVASFCFGCAAAVAVERAVAAEHAVVRACPVRDCSVVRWNGLACRLGDPPARRQRQ